MINVFVLRCVAPPYNVRFYINVCIPFKPANYAISLNPKPRKKLFSKIRLMSDNGSCKNKVFAYKAIPSENKSFYYCTDLSEI